MATTFDRDDYELRWPPQLFVDEVKRLVGDRSRSRGMSTDEMKLLLMEAFTSTVPAEAFEQAASHSATYSWWQHAGNATAAGQWILN